MEHGRRRDELARMTSAEWARASTLAEELARRAGEPPRPGDVYLLEEGLEEAVEWVVLEGDGERWFVVPADAVPLVGSADVAVPASRACGPLSVRCASGMWLDRAPSSRERTGALAREDLERIRERRRAAEAGVAGSVVAREVDEEAEYREWSETVARVRAAVAARHSVAEMPPRATTRRRVPGGAWALAAALLLAATLTLWIRDVRLAEQLSELRNGAAQTNLAVAFLLGDLRSGGSPTAVTLPADGGWLVLILRAPEAAAGTRYRLEMRREGRKDVFWSREGLRDLGSGEITLALPRHLLSSGKYEILLWPPDSEHPARIYSFDLEIEPGPEE